MSYKKEREFTAPESMEKMFWECSRRWDILNDTDLISKVRNVMRGKFYRINDYTDIVKGICRYRKLSQKQRVVLYRHIFYAQEIKKRVIRKNENVDGRP